VIWQPQPFYPFLPEWKKSKLVWVAENPDDQEKNNLLIMMKKVGKKEAGRKLDGKEWNEISSKSRNNL